MTHDILDTPARKWLVKVGACDDCYRQFREHTVREAFEDAETWMIRDFSYRLLDRDEASREFLDMICVCIEVAKPGSYLCQRLKMHAQDIEGRLIDRWNAAVRAAA